MRDMTLATNIDRKQTTFTATLQIMYEVFSQMTPLKAQNHVSF